MKTEILADFEICTSVPLIKIENRRILVYKVLFGLETARHLRVSNVLY